AVEALAELLHEVLLDDPAVELADFPVPQDRQNVKPKVLLVYLNRAWLRVRGDLAHPTVDVDGESDVRVDDAPDRLARLSHGVAEELLRLALRLEARTVPPAGGVPIVNRPLASPMDDPRHGLPPNLLRIRRG